MNVPQYLYVKSRPVYIAKWHAVCLDLPAASKAAAAGAAAKQPQAAAAAAGGGMSDADADLEARLENLRRQ